MWNLLWVGFSVGLALFSIQLLAMGNHQKLRSALAQSVIVSDVLWVVGTFTAASIYGSQLTFLGWLILLSVNGVVAYFAFAQNKAYRQERCLVTA